MSESNKDYLIKRIREYVFNNPEDLPDLQAAINEGFQLYVDKLKSDRDLKACTAVHQMVCMAKIPKELMMIPFLVDIAWYQFPSGTAGQSNGALKFWEDFIKVAKKEKLDRQWLVDTRGIDCLEWWDRHVVPTINEDDNGPME